MNRINKKNINNNIDNNLENSFSKKSFNINSDKNGQVNLNYINIIKIKIWTLLNLNYLC
jgi:hypothetical protein